MSLAFADVPSDPAALRAFAAACQAELQAAAVAVQRNTLEIERLKLQLAKLRRMAFGASSERLSGEIQQLELHLEELEAEPAPPRADDQTDDNVAAEDASETAPTRQQPKRRPLPDHLPREVLIHQPVLATDGACSCGRGRFSALGEDVVEVLEYVPGQFRVVRHTRPKYACTACDIIVQAPAVALPIPRGRAGPALLAHVLVSKYADHLPLYRQAEIYRRQGVELDRSTLADWVGQTCWLLDPLITSIRRHVMAATKLHGDDTPVPVLEPGRGQTRQGRLWVYVRDDRAAGSTDPPAAAFFYSADRTGRHPAQHLAQFRGNLQADAYAGFQALYDGGAITEVACWAHARRKIFDVWKAKQSTIAKDALDQIARLYRIEARLRGLDPEARRAGRADARPILDGFFATAQAALGRISAKTALAEAFLYASKRRTQLSRYLDNGRLEIDNNIAENALRPVALGRKNYLFAGSDAGGRRAADVYTLIQTVKLNSIEPHRFLTTVLDRIAKGHPISRIDELLPWRIA